MEIRIDIGFKTYDIKDADGTLLGTIRFNPGDVGMVGRAKEASAKLSDIAAQYREGDGVDALLGAEQAVRDTIDEVFASPVSDVFFGGISPLTPCEDGRIMAEAVLDSMMPVIEEGVKASADRVKRHTSDYQGTDKGLAPGQKV